MKQIIWIVGVLCLLLFAQAEYTNVLAQEDLNNQELMKALNNYYGCKVWVDDVCTQCSERYYFNNKGICCEVKPECNKFNRQTGLCEGCYQGYDLDNGICKAIDLATSKDRGCRKWKDGVCIECSISWYFGPDNICHQIDDNCKRWKDNGECQQCYLGYITDRTGVNNKCIRDPKPFIPAPDSLCALWKDRVCIRCAPRSVFDENGICRQVDRYCNTWDIFDGECLICYKGYDLKKKACVLAELQKPKDFGCKLWDWDHQKCLECSARFVFDADGYCFQVSNDCASHDASGLCTSCYKGYKLQNGQCVIQNTLCKQTSKDGSCSTCYTGYVLYRSQCVPISKLANLAQYYQECCPQKLAQLLSENRISK